jgi:hypothetical protein
VPQDSTAEREENQPPDNKERSSRKSHVGLLLILLAVVLFIGSFSLFYLSSNKPDEWTRFWIPTIVNVLVLVVIVIQVFTYAKQWESMNDALEETRRIANQNERAVKAAEKNLRLAEEARTNAILDRAVREQERMWEQESTGNQTQLMRESLEETRAIVTQNERVVRAVEVQAEASQASAQAAIESVAATKEAFYIGQRAYVGVRRMTVSNLVAGQYVTLTITWINGGKTPAWRFRSIPKLVLDEQPPQKSGFSWLEDDFSNISVSLIPAGEERTVKYETTLLLTREMVAAIEGGGKRLYASAEGSYTDIKGIERPFRIWALYDVYSEGFVELEDEQKDYYPNPN